MTERRRLDRRSGRDRRRHTPAVAGVLVIVGGGAAVAGVADVVAARTGRPTISRACGRAVLHPVGGPILAGVIGGLSTGLVWHLAQVVADEWWASTR